MFCSLSSDTYSLETLTRPDYKFSYLAIIGPAISLFLILEVILISDKSFISIRTLLITEKLSRVLGRAKEFELFLGGRDIHQSTQHNEAKFPSGCNVKNIFTGDAPDAVAAAPRK